MSGPAIIDISPYLKDKSSPESGAAIKLLTQTLRETSCLIIKDPRVKEADNEKFVDMMEKYYEQPLDEKVMTKN
jgi:hypothetical protein